jgi:ribosomal protein S17E
MKTKSQEAYEKYLKVIEIVKDDDIVTNLLNHLINKIWGYIEIICKNKSKQEKEESQKALVSALSAFNFNKCCSKEFENMPEVG